MKRIILEAVCLLALTLPSYAQNAGCDYTVGKKAFRYELDLSDPSRIGLQVFRQKGGKMKPAGDPLVLSNPVDGASELSMGKLCGTKVFEGLTYAVFSFWSSQSDYTLMACETGGTDVRALTFSGKRKGSVIEGFSDYSIQERSAVLDSLKTLLDADSQFATISEADYLTDKSIDWWGSQNPYALSTASTVTLGIIPENSSLVSGFHKSKANESNLNWKVAVFETRGYTVVVANSKNTGSYTLVWAEPECRNRATDRYLRNVYFESDNTLALFFLRGKSTFKYHLNLATRTLKR